MKRPLRRLAISMCQSAVLVMRTWKPQFPATDLREVRAGQCYTKPVSAGTYQTVSSNQLVGSSLSGLSPIKRRSSLYSRGNRIQISVVILIPDESGVKPVTSKLDVLSTLSRDFPSQSVPTLIETSLPRRPVQ